MLTGEDNFITVPNECHLADPPPVMLIEEFGEEYDNAVGISVDCAYERL